MDGLPLNKSETSGINEATPLLHEDNCEIDDELYAISGACGFSDESISEINIDIEIILQILISAGIQFISEKTNILETKDSIICPQALHAMATVWKQIGPKIKDLLESNLIVPCLTEYIVSHLDQLEIILPNDENINKEFFIENVKSIIARSWQHVLEDDEKERAVHLRESQQRIRDRMRKQNDTSCVNRHFEAIVERLFSVWLKFPPRRANIFKHQDSAFLSPQALQAMSTVWKQIKAETKDLPESKIIIQGLAEHMINYMYRLKIMVPDDEKISKNAFTKHVINIVTRCWQQILDDVEKKDEQEQTVKMEEGQLSDQERLWRKREIVYSKLRYELITDKLFTAWLKDSPRMANVSAHKDSAFLSPAALHAMSTVWKEIKAETDDLPEPKIVAQGLMRRMMNYMYKFKLMVPGPKEEIQAFIEHRENIVERCWLQILAEIEEEEAKERALKKRERRKRFRERLRKEREIAYVNWFYEPFATMDLRGPVDCRIICILLCLCCSKFVMQILIHTTLLAWPISIGTFGGMYMKLCPMSDLMIYTMIAIGFAGPVAILTRLAFAMYENLSGTEITDWWPTILVKILEFVFFVFIIIQLFCFYYKTPSFDHESPDYCDETFYNIIHWINYVSITVSSLWLTVYLIKGMITLHMRRYALRPW